MKDLNKIVVAGRVSHLLDTRHTMAPRWRYHYFRHCRKQQAPRYSEAYVAAPAPKQPKDRRLSDRSKCASHGTYGVRIQVEAHRHYNRTSHLWILRLRRRHLPNYFGGQRKLDRLRKTWSA